MDQASISPTRPPVTTSTRSRRSSRLPWPICCCGLAWPIQPPSSDHDLRHQPSRQRPSAAGANSGREGFAVCHSSFRSISAIRWKADVDGLLETGGRSNWRCDRRDEAAFSRGPSPSAHSTIPAGNRAADRSRRPEHRRAAARWPAVRPVVATNVFVYYDMLDQSLALANVAAMLKPGGSSSRTTRCSSCRRRGCVRGVT